MGTFWVGRVSKVVAETAELELALEGRDPSTGESFCLLRSIKSRARAAIAGSTLIAIGSGVRSFSGPELEDFGGLGT